MRISSAPTATRSFAVPLALLIFVSLLWAATYLLIKVAIVDIPPATLVTARMAVAAAALWLWLRRAGGGLPTDGALWMRYASISLLGQVIPFLLISHASRSTPVGEMAILVATTPIFAVLLASAAKRVWPTLNIMLSVIWGFVGVFGFMAAGPLLTSHENWSGRGELIIAALSYAVSARMVARLPNSNPEITGTGVALCGIPMLLPLSLALEQPWLLVPSARAITAVVLLGVLSTAIAYVAYYGLIRLSGPTFASLHHYLVPPLSIALAAIALGEMLDLRQILCGALILCSVALSSTPTIGRSQSGQRQV